MDHENHQMKIIADYQVLLTEDLISQLPDDILVKMLSLLTFKEAAQTSVLSPRWRYLWTSHPNLNFDSPKLFDEFMYNEDLGKEGRKKLCEHYVNWVNHVVRSYTGSTVHEFMVRYGLDKDDKIHIDQWILFAFKKNVQRLTLDLFGYTNEVDRYTLPDVMNVDAFPHIRHGVTSFSSLTYLKLIYTNTSGEVLQFLLSVCPSLECLLVHYSKNIHSNLEVRSTSLKSFELRFCSKLTSLLVTAPNLVSFTYFGPKITLQLIDSPRLTKMLLGGGQCDHFIYHNPLELSNYFSQLEVLNLAIREKYDANILNMPVLPRLQRLEVSIYPQRNCLLGLGSMLRACPALCEVSFTIFDGSHRPNFACQSDVIVTSPHQSLKVVELIGFVGGVAIECLARYLIKNAVMLEKIIFDTREPRYIGTRWDFKETKEREAGRRCAQHLVESLRPGTTYLII